MLGSVLKRNRTVFASLVLLSLMVSPILPILATTGYNFPFNSENTVTQAPVTLQLGTAGSSVIYANGTSAVVTVDALETTFYPNDNNTINGSYVSGSTPSSVSSVDGDYFRTKSVGTDTSIARYNPSTYNLSGSTNHVSGSTGNSTQNDGVYLTFRSYKTQDTENVDPVDNDSSDVDSNSDLGSSSNFTAQMYGPDTEYDVLVEELILSQLDDYIDSDSSDVDSSPDKGSHSNFVEEQATDSTYDTLTEADTSGSEWLDCDGFTGDYVAWQTESGTSPYLDVQDDPGNHSAGSYIHEDKKGGVQEGWFTFTDTTFTGTLPTNITLYCVGDGNDWIDIYVDWTGSGAGSLAGSITPGTSYGYQTLSLGSQSASNVNNGRVYLTYRKSGGGLDMWVDHARLGVSEATNNELDLEVQFTSVETSHENTDLCIQSGTTGAEDLNVEIWNTTSSLWELLVSDITQNDWTNVTIANYVSSTVTIRFKGGTETSDSTQDNWQIDAVLLRQYNQTYMLDLEAQFTSVATSEANEYLCVYGGTMGGENIIVDVWHDSSWNIVFSDLSAGWNNASISSYLTSLTFTVRFRGGTETSDNVQDQWEIDITQLHTWTVEYTAEVELIGDSDLYEWTQLNRTLDSSWTTDSVQVTIQLYDYNADAYSLSGDGYETYTSGAADVDQINSEIISSNPEYFRNATGSWRVKVKGVKLTDTQFDLNIDFSEFASTYYSEYTVSTEFTLDDVSDNQSPSLNFTVMSHNSIDGVTVMIQVWNYSESGYASSGQGYLTYASTGSNVTKILNITDNAGSCLNGAEAKIRITCVNATTQAFTQYVNLIRLLQETKHGEYDFVLKAQSQIASLRSVRLRAYADTGRGRLINCTVSFKAESKQVTIIDGEYTQQTGVYTLLPGLTSYNITVHVSATYTGTSIVYMYLDVKVPGTSTHTGYPIKLRIQ